MEKSLLPEPATSSNLIFIEFYDKKNFPPGIWMREPDYCEWQSHGLNCLAIRDMSLGMWRGFVKLTQGHPAYGKNFKQLLDANLIDTIEIHGGLSTIGKLPTKYKDQNKDSWWIGFECTQGEDYLPLLNHEDFGTEQTYKTLQFVRNETIYLARSLSRIRPNE